MPPDLDSVKLRHTKFIMRKIKIIHLSLTVALRTIQARPVTVRLPHFWSHERRTCNATIPLKWQSESCNSRMVIRRWTGLLCKGIENVLARLYKGLNNGVITEKEMYHRKDLQCICMTISNASNIQNPCCDIKLKTSLIWGRIASQNQTGRTELRATADCEIRLQVAANNPFESWEVVAGECHRSEREN
ncbi:hypothetical protein TNCV_1403921 [Trichonephila clavipes]|nr:hypothetical protein TNCV_1403921 [Trichonephila clavipes]